MHFLSVFLSRGTASELFWKQCYMCVIYIGQKLER